jgi:hypothetical protein
MVMRFAGVCGILGSVLPLIMILSATLLSSWFRWDKNALSELGVGEQALLFNSAILLGGLLNLLFALGLRQYFWQKEIDPSRSCFNYYRQCLSGSRWDFHGRQHSDALDCGFELFYSGSRGPSVNRLWNEEKCGSRIWLCMWNPSIAGYQRVSDDDSRIAPQSWVCHPELIESLTISTWTVFMSAKLLTSSR